MIVDTAATVTADRIRNGTRVGQRKVLLVAGGPPCQGFSLIGKRAIDDPRNSLVREYVRLVAELGADYFIFENVEGITVGQQADFLRDVIALFAGYGYAVVMPWRVLNARDFGVPQNRERLILMGHRHGLCPPDYPRQTGIRVTCGDALRGIPDADAFPELARSDSVRCAGDAGACEGAYAAEMRTRGSATGMPANRGYGIVMS